VKVPVKQETGEIVGVPWHGVIGLSFMVVPEIAGMSV